jgi:aspartate carbamoyltransferase catalytic subunit
MTWDRRHLMDVDRFGAADLELILDAAAQLRRQIEDGGGWLDGLSGKSVALLFLEPSTRTRMSFELAARRVGAQTFLFDAGSSSLTKGESFVDTVRNLDAIGFDVLVMRHHRAGAAAVAARHFSGSVVNAGDGWHAHPTQALLDALTMRRALGDLRGRKVVIVGDILHSRVARSNAHLLSLAGVDVWLCAPRAWLRAVEGSQATLTDDLDAALRDAAVVMGLRVQKERMAGGKLSVGTYIERYQVTEERLARLTPTARFMHPGPINEGVEVTREVALGPRSLVMEQVRNGVPVRMAVLAALRREGAQTTSATRDLSSVMR